MFQKHRPTSRHMFHKGHHASRHDLFNKHRGDIHAGNVWKAAYGHERSMERLRQKGFVLDTNLSNDNQSVWIRPRDHKAIFTIAGTHNHKSDQGHILGHQDIQTDIAFAAGGLTQTKRYQEAQNVYDRARAKYHDFNFTVAGHSLGGALAGSVARPTDTLVTHSRASSLTTRLAPNEQAFRHTGDWVSATTANQPGMTTLPGGTWWNPLASHDIANARGSNIWI